MRRVTLCGVAVGDDGRRRAFEATLDSEDGAAWAVAWRWEGDEAAPAAEVRGEAALAITRLLRRDAPRLPVPA